MNNRLKNKDKTRDLNMEAKSIKPQAQGPLLSFWTVLTAKRCFSRWLFLKSLYIEYISHIVHDSTPNSFHFTGRCILI